MADPETELDAAERALGTLPREGETLADARLRREWEMRLAPLAELVTPAPPGEGLLARIMARIDEDDPARALARARRRASDWRRATFAVTAAAAIAAAVAIVVLPLAPAPGPRLVSVATAPDGAPALVISLDPEAGRATIRPVGLDAPASGSLELWHIPQGGAPVSLGLITAGEPVEVALSAAPGDLAAVSLEPPGGSPTGQPTGPVLYSGPFVALP